MLKLYFLTRVQTVKISVKKVMANKTGVGVILSLPRENYRVQNDVNCFGLCFIHHVGDSLCRRSVTGLRRCLLTSATVLPSSDLRSSRKFKRIIKFRGNVMNSFLFFFTLKFTSFFFFVL